MHCLKLISPLLIAAIYFNPISCCLEAEKIAPCTCSGLAKLSDNNFALLCEDVSQSELIRIFAFINTTDFEDNVTNFYGNRIAFTDNRLSGKIFYYLTRLRTIYVTNSNLENIDRNIFPVGQYYDEINMSQNRLLGLPKDLFLNVLNANFSYNQIQEIPRNSFFKFTTVDLSHNLIHSVRKMAFQFEFYTNSKILLSHNRLSDASFEKDFAPQHSVILDVSSNQLTYLDRNIFDNLHRLTALNNPLKCDCRMKWLATDKYFTIAAKCPNGLDFVKAFVNGNTTISDCASRLVIEDNKLDGNIFYPCNLTQSNDIWAMGCLSANYENTDAMFAKLSMILVNKVNISRVLISDMSFSETILPRIKGTFMDSIVFQDITITRSQMKIIDREAFYPSYRSAIKIDLSFNKLRDDSGVFPFLSKFQQVEQISLSGNKLTTIPALQFKNLQKLKYLDVSDNQLKSIQESAFVFDHLRLEYRYLQIDLKSNKLDRYSFAQNFIEVRPTLSIKLTITQNELVCLDRTIFGPFLGLLNSNNQLSVDFLPSSQSDWCD
ncbi:hypothetical protein HDE_04350 [Halotydeus destructor]|nr:hypothetical protein HDE_04350 [Halotydeus destructor]